MSPGQTLPVPHAFKLTAADLRHPPLIDAVALGDLVIVHVRMQNVVDNLSPKPGRNARARILAAW